MVRNAFPRILIILLVSVIILILLSSGIWHFIKHAKLQARVKSCKSNLRVISNSLFIYLESYGKTRYFPDARGASFLSKLYELEIIHDYRVYLCPGTMDSNNKGKALLQLMEGDPDNACSYAGRKYPRIDLWRADERLTPLCGDDIDQPAGQGENHFPLVLFATLDGGIDELDLTKQKEEEEIHYLRNPLTN